MVDFIPWFLNSISVTRDSDLVGPRGSRNEGRKRRNEYASEVLLSLPADSERLFSLRATVLFNLSSVGLL